jgi:general L-amino acid transport system substrate-binding protein
MQPFGLFSTRAFAAAACLAGTLLAGSFAAPPAARAQAPAGAANTFDAVRSRGTLVCGVNTGTPGFAQPDSQGVWRGLDVDYCRAVAAALFGDPNKVRYVPTTAQSRFTALQSGEVDLLARNTTWTLSRDTSLGFDFAGINFYDGQGFMVKQSTGAKAGKDLEGATICVQPGTTTEQNLTEWARANRITFTPVVIERLEEVVQAYVSGRCDAYTTDISGLAASRSVQPNSEEHVILPDVISKEPLGPLVRQGDARFADVVRWVHFLLISAEEFGITQANVNQMMNDPRPEVQRMLGKGGDLGKMLGLDNAWGANVLKAVGNYGEIFDRNLKPIGIARGPNDLWNKGGLQYSPPFR